jgi:hypothetical protein
MSTYEYDHIFCYELMKDINHRYCQMMYICNSVRFGNFIVFAKVSMLFLFLVRDTHTQEAYDVNFQALISSVLVLVLNVDALFYCLSTCQFVIDEVLNILSVGDFNHRKRNLGFCLTLPTRLNFTCSYGAQSGLV